MQDIASESISTVWRVSSPRARGTAREKGRPRGDETVLTEGRGEFKRNIIISPVQPALHAQRRFKVEPGPLGIAGVDKHLKT